MHFVGHKISLIVLALVVLIMPACLTDKEEVEVYVGEGYYRAINIDFDGATSYSPIAYIQPISTYNLRNARVAGDSVLELVDKIVTDCFTLETHRCYDGPIGATTLNALGGKFGFNLIWNDDCDVTDITVIKNELSSKRYPNPFSTYEFNVGTFWTEGSVFDKDDIYTSPYREPDTGIIWIPELYDPSEPTYNWKFWLSINGKTYKLETQIRFDNNTLIPEDAKCTAFALPVTWISVDVTRSGYCNLFTFTVAEQIDVNYYEIQFSTDAVEWETVGMVAPLDFDKGTYTYDFEHCNNE